MTIRPVDDHRPHVGGFDRIGEVGHRVVERDETVLVEVDDHDVGTLADLERADLLIEAERARSPDRRHLERHDRRHRQRIEPDALVEQRGELDLGEEIELVVARRTVRPEPDDHAGAEHVRHRRDAAGELQVAARIVHDAGAARGQERDLFAVDPYAVRGDEAGIEDPEVLQMAHGRESMPSEDLLLLLLRLGEVRDERDVPLLGERVEAPIQLGRDGVRRVRRERGNNAPVAAPARDEVGRVRDVRLDVQPPGAP
jgi:hypothetical protein